MMRWLGAILGLFAGLLAVASPALAEDRKPPSPLFASPYDWGAKGDPRAFSSLAFYANCVVDAERGLTVKFLAKDYTPKNREGPTEDLLVGAGLCMADIPALKLTFEYLRGALIEAAYDKDVLKKSGKPFMALGASLPEKASSPPAIAHCIVDRRPSEAAALLNTVISSDGQARAIRQLEPDLDECVRSTNSKSVFPEILRFQIAEELYRRAANRPSLAEMKP